MYTKPKPHFEAIKNTAFINELRGYLRNLEASINANNEIVKTPNSYVDKHSNGLTN